MRWHKKIEAAAISMFSGRNAIASDNNHRISGMFERRRSLNNGGQRGTTFRENSGI